MSVTTARSLAVRVSVAMLQQLTKPVVEETSAFEHALEVSGLK